MSDIPDWIDRCEVHPDHQSGMVTHGMIKARMQEEIDDLRAEVEAQRRSRQIDANEARAREQELRAEVEALRADAERYEWLRAAPPNSLRWTRFRVEHWNGQWDDARGDALDALIDAARGKP